MSEDGSIKLDPNMQYEDHQWHSLTKNDKKQVWKMRKDAGVQRGKPSGSRFRPAGGDKRHNMLKRKLAALQGRKANEVLEREIAALEGLPASKDDNKAIDDESVAEQTRSKKPDNAGGQFGRHAHRGR
jgi:hypothetical protein